MTYKKIEHDVDRFKKIIKGKIKNDLRKHMSRRDLTGQQGGKTVKIPIHSIDIPRFRFDEKSGKDVGQGDGEPGDAIGKGKPGDKPGKGDKPGENEGEKAVEVEVTLEELAQWMHEELELPRLEPKDSSQMESLKKQYKSVSKEGPKSLRSFKRTYKEALKRQVSTGQYNPDNPIIIPRKEDFRYRSWKVESKPTTNAVIIYVMDVSGSMGNEHKDIVRTTSFWLETYLKSTYKECLEHVYVIHDSTAKEVNRHDFFHTSESGGTKISTAYELANEIILKRYPPSEWNIYLFHFSDGDNWGSDNGVSLALLNNDLLPMVNLFGYGQIDLTQETGGWGSRADGEFLGHVVTHLSKHPKVATSQIKGRDEIWNCIKDILGKG